MPFKIGGTYLAKYFKGENRKSAVFSLLSNIYPHF